MVLKADAYHKPRANELEGRLFLTNKRLLFLPSRPRLLPAFRIWNRPVTLPLGVIECATFRPGQDRFSWMAMTPNMEVALRSGKKHLFAVIDPVRWIGAINAQLTELGLAETTEDEV